MQKELKSNLWKYFLILLTNRRNYLPILSLYFLTIPNSTAQQIGLYTGIGWIMGFLLEIPSGYIADKFGHKKSLILAKFSMLASTLFLSFGKSLPYFILGASFTAIGFAFTSGTAQAFLHNTLTGLKRSSDYSSISGKIGAKVSLISAAMILLLPILTKISLVMPIKVYLIFDIIGILVAFSLFSPKIKYEAEDIEGESIFSQLKKFKGTGFYVASFFIAVLGSFTFGLSPYKEAFVRSLGFPIIFIGSIMALSRVIWFIVGHNLNILKKVKLKTLLLCEVIIMPLLFIAASQISNPYIVGFLLAITSGYLFGRAPLIEEYSLNHFLINKRYKATMLSIQKQISNLFESGITFGAGFLMAISYSKGYLISGICMLVLLLLFYPFARNKFNN